MSRKRLTESTDVEGEKLFVTDEIDDIKAVLDTASGTDSSKKRHSMVRGQRIETGSKKMRCSGVLYSRLRALIRIRSEPAIDFGGGGEAILLTP
jgi:hypothetical protein